MSPKMPSPLKGIPDVQKEEAIQDQRRPQRDTPKLLFKNKLSWIAAKKISNLVTKKDVTTGVAKPLAFCSMVEILTCFSACPWWLLLPWMGRIWTGCVTFMYIWQQYSLIISPLLHFTWVMYWSQSWTLLQRLRTLWACFSCIIPKAILLQHSDTDNFCLCYYINQAQGIFLCTGNQQPILIHFLNGSQTSAVYYLH